MLTTLDIYLLIGIFSFLLLLLITSLWIRFCSSKSKVEEALQKSKRQYLAYTEAKKWTEMFFIKYSVIWISWFGIVVLSGIWETFGPNDYMIVGLCMAIPCFLLPFIRSNIIITNNTIKYLPNFLQYLINILLPLMPEEELSRPVYKQFWVKSNAWIAILSFIGNYFWTHYFYRLLRATYTFSAHRINFVPIAMFLCTHAYFCTYHTLTTLVLRRWYSSATYYLLGEKLKLVISAGLIFALALFTALTEAVTIQNFPYYHIEDREWFYSVGSIVYSIYFIVSFPAYYLLDENVINVKKEEELEEREKNSIARKFLPALPAQKSLKEKGRRGSQSINRNFDSKPHSSLENDDIEQENVNKRTTRSILRNDYSLIRACTESLAACMLVTLLLEVWRLVYTGARGLSHPGLLPFTPSNVSIDGQGLPWM
jgi:cycloeucalenol cycloisomerase